MPKSLFVSRTFWVNTLTAVAGVLTILSGHADLIPSAVMPYIVIGLAGVNVLLRIVTTQPVAVG